MKYNNLTLLLILLLAGTLWFSATFISYERQQTQAYRTLLDAPVNHCQGRTIEVIEVDGCPEIECPVCNGCPEPTTIYKTIYQEKECPVCQECKQCEECPQPIECPLTRATYLEAEIKRLQMITELEDGCYYTLGDSEICIDDNQRKQYRIKIVELQTELAELLK